MIYQLCNKCFKNLPLSEFHKSKNYMLGHRKECKSCRKSESKDYYGKNSDRLKLNAANLRKRNPELNKKYYYENYDYFKLYRESKRDHYKLWRKNNKKRINESRRKRIKEDLDFRLGANLRSRLSTLLRRSKTNKSNSALKLLGCSLSEFKKYLEGLFVLGMNWENYGEWHIDHIKPCAAFDLSDPLQQKECFHFTNLQPLWALDNLKKSSKY